MDEASVVAEALRLERDGRDEAVKVAASSTKTENPAHEQKNKKLKRQVKEFCYEFARSGTCPYGDSRCRFNHDYESFFGSSHEFFERQKSYKESSPDLIRDPSLGEDRFALPPPPFHRSFETSPHEDTSVVLHAHNNCVVAVCVSTSHPIFSNQYIPARLVSVKFTEYNSLKVSDVIAKIVTEQGEEFQIRTPLPGVLLETNDKLTSQPQMLLDDPLATGFLALIKPSSPYQLFLPRYFRLIAVSAEADREEAGDIE